MLSTLQRLMNRARVDDSDGFTLIELLIVVVIIGILAAIAIPQFADTKQSAYEATVKSDLRNAMTSLETDFASSGTYPSGQSGASNIVETSQNVSISGWSSTSTADTYCIQMDHTNLTNNWAVANASSEISGYSGSSYSPGTPVESGTCG